MITAFRIGLAAALLTGTAANAQELTIATVNNGDMIRMQRLTQDFTDSHPGITLNWVTLEENVLRQRVTTDIATKGGQYDILTIGNYEVPIWGAQGWLAPLDDLGADYDTNDILPAIRTALSVEDTLYAVPFYAEGAMVMYRTDLMEKAGLTMPEKPEWSFIKEAAAKMNDPSNGVYGICLRGKAGWGENMALITMMANAYGARWFDMDWKPQFDSPEWKAAFSDYIEMVTQYGPPGVSSNGFNENLALFQTGKCGMWIDATSGGSFVSDPAHSEVADKVGFAEAPSTPEGNQGSWLWSWNLAIPASSPNIDAAKEFVAWATSKEYLSMVAEADGWVNVPPGTRTSLYENQDYLDAAPFAQITYGSMNATDTQHPSVQETPYTGAQFVAIPEFQAIGTAVGQVFSAAAAGTSDTAQALSAAQALTQREIQRAGYPK